MITVAELAKSCNTSTTTIYRTLKDVQQGNTERLTEKRKGTTYITPECEKLIREQLNAVEQNNESSSTAFNGVERVEHSGNDEILFLRRQNETLLQELARERQESSKEREQNQTILEREREHSRQQAERLAELSEKLAELTKNEQIINAKNTMLLPDERPTDTSAEESNTQSNKKSLWHKIFRQKKSDS